MNLAAIVEGHPDDAVALVTRGAAVTYGELRAEVARVRGGLVALGLEPGDRVALLCANNRLFVTAYLAVLGAGLVAVPLNPLSPPAELEAEVAATTPRAAIVGPAAARTFVADVEHVLLAEDVAALDGDAPLVDRAPEDLAVLVFTAGTAGEPRPAMLTHGNLLVNLRQLQAVPDRDVRAGDVALGALPLFHIYGLNVVLGGGLAAGATVVLVERFDPATTMATVRDRGCTVVAGVPAMWEAWARLPEADPGAFASVRLAASGAAPLTDGTRTAVRERLGIDLDDGYGLTEASPVVTAAGRPVPGVELRLVDEDGEDVPLGDPGELWVRGPNVFAGYWGDAEATAAVLTPDGWLRTGDLAVVDGGGSVRLVDRLKDLVIVSGFNVVPAEVEAVLTRHPAVAEAAVVGVPHPHTGEAVKAFVVPVPGGHVEEDELVAFCAERLARYKCPDKILFVEALPTSAGGKVRRRSLTS